MVIKRAATRQNLTYYQQKIQIYERGFNLLKSKKDVILIKFKEIEEKYKEIKEDVDGMFKEGYYHLSKAEYYGANINLMQKELGERSIRLKVNENNVAGLVVTHFIVDESAQSCEPVICGKGSTEMLEASEIFKDAVKTIIELSSLTSAYKALKESLDNATRRVNSLEIFLIPEAKKIVKEITLELEEQEREEFYRLKKVQKKISEKK